MKVIYPTEFSLPPSRLSSNKPQHRPTLSPPLPPNPPPPHHHPYGGSYPDVRVMAPLQQGWGAASWLLGVHYLDLLMVPHWSTSTPLAPARGCECLTQTYQSHNTRLLQHSLPMGTSSSWEGKSHTMNSATLCLLVLLSFD